MRRAIINLMALCNAPLAHTDGYCLNGAGEGTDHPGEGRCSYHGGDTINDGIDDLLKAVGLSDLISKATTMSPNDIERLYHVSNTGLTLVRAQLVAKLASPDLSAKETTDLTGSINRIDTILAKYKREAKGAKQEAEKAEADNAEHDRLDALAAEMGVGT